MVYLKYFRIFVPNDKFLSFQLRGLSFEVFLAVIIKNKKVVVYYVAAQVALCVRPFWRNGGR